MMKRCCLILLSVMLGRVAYAQDSVRVDGERSPLSVGLEYNVEMQSTFSKGTTPLWLNANRYGLSSLANGNGYLRAGVFRPLSADSARHWGLGGGLDLAVPYNFTSDIVVQQAFVELRWLRAVLAAGSKEYPMELKNNMLSSGSQTLGINARPVPQVRLALPEYWTLPFTNGWVHLKGHVAYGIMTDQRWQHSFTRRESNYANRVLYHSKAGYLKIGKDNDDRPLSVELGIEMACTFGGTSYIADGNGGMKEVKNDTGLRSFWNAFWPGGSDKGETTYKNVEGNQLGSWLLRVNWDAEEWRLGVYADKYFEDHSGMFMLDYDGYGSGEEWQDKKDNRWLLYDLQDIMLGAELNLRRNGWINNVVFEYICTKYQSGPIYHDHTQTIPDHIGGKDNYYNHSMYTGWQHWGQVIGNPLYRSPIYNDDGTIRVKDNRFKAYHLGFDGRPLPRLSYRVMASWQEGFGTYDDPYDKPQRNFSFLVECRYAFKGRLLDGWSVKGGYGMDFGRILGNNYGLQITVAKNGRIRF